MRRFLRENALSLFFTAFFVAALIGQSLTGLAEFNEQQLAAGLEPASYLAYVTSSDFGVDVAENWQSEFLQFFLYVTATVWLLQKGSSESKDLGKAGRESDEEQLVGDHATQDSPRWARASGWRLGLYSHSLGMVMGLIFVLSWTAQPIAGRAAFNAQQLGQRQDPVGYWAYVASPDFWSRTFQNRQSEFLAVASMAVLAIYLRERGSPESKPVGQPHHATGQEG